MEHSKANLGASDLSLNASDSQFVGHSYSLSLPSEPPELRNWFSSYEYESPALGYTDNFGCTISKEGEIAKDRFVNNEERTRGKEENLGGFMEIGEKEKMLVGEKLNSNGFEECTSFFVDDKIDNQSLNKNKDCSYSPLLLSEPPDIRNWFSSYAYESPTFDASDNFMHFVYKESKSKKDGFAVEESNIGKEENFGEFMRSISCDEKVVVSEVESSRLENCKDCWRDNKQKKQPSNKAVSRIEVGKENLSATFEQCSKYQGLQNRGTNSANDVKISSLDEEGPQCTTSISTEIGSMPLKIQKSFSVASKKLIDRMESIQENSEMKDQTQADGHLAPESALKSIVDNGASMRKSTHGCNGKEEIDNQSLNKNKDCSYSPLLLSEPTDIRNWFSSYVYESPAFDTSDDFMRSVFKENKSKKDGFVVEESNVGKEENFGEFMGTSSSDERGVVSEVESSRLENCDDCWRENKQKKQPSNKAVSRIEVGKENLSATFEQSSKYQGLQNRGTNSANDVKISSLDEEGPQCTTSISNEIGSMPLKIQKSSSVASKKLIDRMESIQENSEMKDQTQADGHLAPESALKSIVDNGASMRKSTHGCNGKEEIGKEISSNGFVTTRKGRYGCANDENSSKVDQKENREGTVSLAGGKDPLVKRKALSETTNLHLSSGVEITGKWQCPQKKKPNLGPPMKQLRLERWVHRM